MSRLVSAILAWMLTVAPAFGQVCARPQNNGIDVSTSSGQIVNGYFTPANGTYTAGTSPSFAVSGARGSVTWSSGDMVLLVQMQCVNLDRTESDTYGDGAAGRPGSGYLETTSGCKVGRYEYVPINTATVASISIGAALQYTYEQANPTASTPRRSFQIVRVPQFGNLTLGGTLVGLPWNGTNGGVLAMDVARNLNFAGQTIDAAAIGFRGGGGRQSTTNGDNPQRHREGDSVSHASKAEGIAGTPRYLWTDDSPFDRSTIAGTFVDSSALSYAGYPGTGTTADYDFARGAPGNAGGGGQYYNDTYHNGGGGGGGNGGAGGRGAFGWRSAGWATVSSDYSNIEAVTGQHLAAFGGGAFGGAGIARVVMGGGGGAGDHNGNSGDTNGPLSNGRTSGATGGGIVMIRAGSMTGGGTIDLRGGWANDNPLNDAAGAAGAGGSAILISPNWTAGSLVFQAAGGRGGDSWLGGGSAHSGGGGGGGGVVVRTGAATVDVSGGSNGITNTADSPPGGIDHGALPGNTGVDLLVSAGSDPVTNAGYLCLPQVDLQILKTVSPSSIGVGATTHFTLTIANSGPQQATQASVQDTLPSGLGTLTFVSASGSNGSTTLTASSISGGTSFVGTVALPVNQTLTIMLRATGSAVGAPINRATVTAPALAVDPDLSNNVGTAQVTIGPVADLSVAKSASPTSIQIGQTTTFTLTFSNLSASTGVSQIRLTDTLPVGLGTLTFVSASGTGGGTLTASSIAAGVFSGTATLPALGSLTVRLRATGGSTGAVVNTATIAAPGSVTEVVTANNVASALVNIGTQADLSVSKRASPTVINQDQTTVFTVTIANLGPGTATSATFLDSLPSGLSGMTLLSLASSGAGATVTAVSTSSSQASGTMTLPAGTSVTIVLRAIAGGVGEQLNSVTVTAPASAVDPVPSNNSAQASVTIPLPTTVTITKSDGQASVNAGASTTYTITIVNTGPNAANNTLLTDTAATGISCTSVQCSSTGGAVCPTPLNVPSLQGSGLLLSTFPANSTFTFAVQCGVTATGR